MKQRKVICEKCNGAVESSGDLVTDVVGLSAVAYHEHCYMSDLRKARGFLLSGRPLNSWIGNFSTLLMVIPALISLFNFKEIGFVFFISLIPIGYRLYSYFTYERPLKDWQRE